MGSTMDKEYLAIIFQLLQVLYYYVISLRRHKIDDELEN